MGFGEIKTDINVENAIVETIAFFDLFSYPLTVFEIWKYIDSKCELWDILVLLENSREKSLPNPPLGKGRELSGIIEHKNGFYFLAGREEIIEIKMARYNYSDRKFKRAVLAARIFKFIPWIKMIAVGNIIGAHNLKNEGDIDFFIITEKSRVWLTRFFCVLAMEILGWRHSSRKSRDKICLSFFVDEEAMNLEPLMLDNESYKLPRDCHAPSRLGGSGARNDRGEKDIYFIYWLAGLVPIYDKRGAYKRFTEANSWLKEYLPNWREEGPNYRRNVKESSSWLYRNLFNLFFGGLEKKMRKLQLKILPAEIKNIMNQDKGVVVNEKIIKLHTKDRRAEYRSQFKARSEKLKIVL